MRDLAPGCSGTRPAASHELDLRPFLSRASSSQYEHALGRAGSRATRGRRLPCVLRASRCGSRVRLPARRQHCCRASGAASAPRRRELRPRREAGERVHGRALLPAGVREHRLPRRAEGRPRTRRDRLRQRLGSGVSPRHAHDRGGVTRSFRGDVTRTLAAGDPTCWSGYYHGVLERSLVKVKSRRVADLAPVARTLCTGEGMAPLVLYGCLHGMGHGLMIATGLDLPTSLEVCARLGRWWDRDACRGGAFMENISSSYGVSSRWLKDDDPVYPCNWVADAVARRCYQMVTSRILPFVGDDWERTATTCAGVEKNFVHMCFQSFGRDASSRSGRDPDKVAELCEIARPYGGEGDCVAAAGYDTTFNFTSGERGRALCEVVPVGVRGSLLLRSGNGARTLSHDTRGPRCGLQGARRGCRARGRVCPRRSREPAELEQVTLAALDVRPSRRRRIANCPRGTRVPAESSAARVRESPRTCDSPQPAAGTRASGRSPWSVARTPARQLSPGGVGPSRRTSARR